MAAAAGTWSTTRMRTAIANLGRHTLIEPVEWTADGWFKPLYSRDRVPAAAVVRNHRIASDDFSQPSLGLQWQFSGIASMEEYSVGNGAVTVTAEPGKFKVLNSEAADHNYEASVRVDPAPGAESGLILIIPRRDFGEQVSRPTISSKRRPSFRRAVRRYIAAHHCRRGMPGSTPGSRLGVVLADDRFPASRSSPSGSFCVRIPAPVQAHLA